MTKPFKVSQTPSGTFTRMAKTGRNAFDVSFGSSVTSSFLFFSDWTAATGFNATAATDGGKWTTLELGSTSGVPTEGWVVEEPSTVGWTGRGNPCRQYINGADCYVGIRSVIPESTTHWVRFYFRMSGACFGGQHPHGYGLSGGTPLAFVAWGWRGPSADTPGPYWLAIASLGEYASEEFVARNLANNDRAYLQLDTWYRYEWMMQYITPTTFKFWPRVYDSSNNLLISAGPTDGVASLGYFREGLTSTYEVTLGDYQDSGQVYTMLASYNTNNYGTITGPDIHRILELTMPGNHGTSQPTAYQRCADLAVSLDGWIGA